MQTALTLECENAKLASRTAAKAWPTSAGHRFDWTAAMSLLQKGDMPRRELLQQQVAKGTQHV